MMPHESLWFWAGVFVATVPLAIAWRRARRECKGHREAWRVMHTLTVTADRIQAKQLAPLRALGEVVHVRKRYVAADAVGMLVEADDKSGPWTRVEVAGGPVVAAGVAVGAES
jgi:hypothetical protein